MQVTIKLNENEVRELCAKQLANQLNLDEEKLKIELFSIPADIRLQYNKDIPRSNKIELIKFIRDAQYKFCERNIPSLETKCMGLAEAKSFVERYFNIQ